MQFWQVSCTSAILASSVWWHLTVSHIGIGTFLCLHLIVGHIEFKVFYVEFVCNLVMFYFIIYRYMYMTDFHLFCIESDTYFILLWYVEFSLNRMSLYFCESDLLFRLIRHFSSFWNVELIAFEFIVQMKCNCC